MGRISTLISQRKFRIWGIAAILVVTMAALAGGIATGATATCDNPNVASIQTLPGSSFEIDTNANLQVDDPDCIDWLTGNASSGFRPGVDWKLDTASGSLDESFGEGTKEDTANPTIVNGSIPPNKSDLKAFGLYAEDLAGTDGTLALFWSRVQDPSGTTNMDFELNQKFCNPAATPTNCAGNGVTPVRTGNGQNTAGPDDILITYDLSRGGSQATISVRYWTGSAWGPANPIANATGALGSINSTTIGTSPIGSLDPRTFGEAAVTFDALFGDNQCGSFGSAYLKSRSSDSFTAALKDFVPPEQVNVSNCPAALTTDATDSATLGATPPNNQIRDTATLDIPAGTNGSIEFKLYGPFATAAEITASSCTAAKLVSGATSTATVTNFNPASPTYNSALFTPTQAGFYNWTAQFTSTTPGVDSTGVFGCGVGLEQSVVNPASPDLTTNATQQVTIGNPIKDTATLTGATANATGGITFKLYGPFDASTPASGDSCVDSGAGANLVTTLGPVPIGSPNAQGNYVVESPEYTPTQAGRYQWVASYNGDNNNNAKTSECRAANEASVVEPRAPELTTNATTPVTIDDPISDTATLTGATNDATGTVTFKLYGPFDPDTPASGDTCNETTLVTTLGPVDIGSPNANGDYVVSSGDYRPTEVGRYQWIASYSGDANNGAVTGNCGDANEASVVDKAPANIETAQKLFPQDSATLSATAGGTPTGTVTFKLYGPDNSTCSAGGAAPVYSESDVTLTNGTANTDNTTFSVDQAKSGNYKWLVTYSGDEDHEDATSECGKEAFTANIDNDTEN